MAEVHVWGQIVSGRAFGRAGDPLRCQWKMVLGDAWELVQGSHGGLTQSAYSTGWWASRRQVVWCTPLDVHLVCKSLNEWPKLSLQIWRTKMRRDGDEEIDLSGYGFCHVPCAPGQHRVEVVTWAPLGSWWERIRGFFFGGSVQLKFEDIVHSPVDRYRLRTRSSGSVTVELNVATKDFHRFRISHSAA